MHAMLRFSISLFALVLIAGNGVRAEKIDFSWQSSFTPSVIPMPRLGGGSLYLINGAGTGNNAVSVPYWVGSSAGSFGLQLGLGSTNQSFTMTLKLTDGPSGLSKSLIFHGIVSTYPYLGLSNTHAGGAFYSFSDGIRSLTIDHDTYHIQFLGGSLFGLGPDPAPDISAKIDVTAASTTPEPSSLLLTAIALPVLGFVRRKKPAAPTSKS